MSSVQSPPKNLAELLYRLGDIPPDRVRFQPPPGTAVVPDVLEHRMCELVEGVLVEKAMGWVESQWAMELGRIIGNFVKAHKLGVITGSDSTQEISENLVRIPDVSYFSWDRMPGHKLPKEPVPFLAPDLAVEVLSRSNTGREMARKRKEYFEAGVRQVWIIDPRARTVQVYTSAVESITLTEADVLTGGEVLPGFTLSLREFFAELDEGPRN